MRGSTWLVREKLDALHNEYFNSKDRYDAIENGKAAFMGRYDKFIKRTMALHKTAETTTAHEKIDRFIILLNNDCIAVKNEFFKEV